MSYLVDSVAKRLRALRLGVLFGRTQSFRLPARIRVGGRWHTTDLPAETGVEVAFLELLFADCYALSTVPPTLRTVLDVGANVGIFAIAARQRFPDAAIHCYEPNPAVEKPLRVQAAAAGATVFMEAVCSRPGRVSLALGAESVLTRTIPDPQGTIPSTGIADALERLAPGGGSVDLVKLDCEGAEWGLLTDPAPWQRVQRLAMEYHLSGDQTIDGIRRLVEGTGMQIRTLDMGVNFGLIIASR